MIIMYNKNEVYFIEESTFYSSSLICSKLKYVVVHYSMELKIKIQFNNV